MLGKLSRLPRQIRDQLNQRLDDAQEPNAILQWLNSLPEVQAVVNAHFDGKPIDGGNLSEYRKRAFRKSQIHRAALEFASGFAAQDSPDQPPAVLPRIEHFVQWLSLRLAAVAESSDVAENTQAELRDIRSFLDDIVALRCGELISRRISLEEQRLALLRAKHQQELESQFWDWTKRPDIQARLYPHRDPDQLRRDVVRMLDRQLLGIVHPKGGDPDPDPACSI
ncbi:MAG TPA: hypothetical protein VNZ64_05850 [Candidatus Acidoferrum sp.]|jgi:hypothetical protein|nr:hypothetical protein [Candidatus Acidoferrum sp.]